MFEQPDFNQFSGNSKKRFVGVLFFVVLAGGTLYGLTNSGVGNHEISVANDNEGFWNRVANVFTISSEKKITIDNDPDYVMPKSDDGRWDLLVLGIRGEDDENADEAGALLTDTMILISQNRTTGKVSMVSIPRDLYVRIYGEKMDKINSVYEVGLLNGNGLSFTKKLLSKITGVYIDSAVVINFSAFKKIIDDLGGIDVYLERPFKESLQWGYEFYLPAGENHLDGQTALYYVRSRFSSSDFDRAQRQQKVITAIKDKVTNLNLISDPIKTLSILNTIRANIDTDLNIWDIKSLMNLSEQFSGTSSNIEKFVFTTDNFLYETHISNLYVLLPRGDNLQSIKQLFQDILK